MSDSPPITAFAQAILEVTAPITQMLDHMMRAPGEPDIHDVVRTMKSVLENVLAPLEEDADLRAATRLVDTAATMVAGEPVLPSRIRIGASVGARGGAAPATEHISRRQRRETRGIACVP